MLAPLLTRILQHLCRQNNWAKPHLRPHAGKVFSFQIPPVSNQLEILQDGSLAIAAKTSTPDATIRISPSLALRLLAGDLAARNQIQIEGDTHLAADIGKVLQQMRWDIEDDASKIVGDVAAAKLGEFALKTGAELRRQARNATETFAEFWQEEKPILAKKRHIEAFNRDVDALASDVARLEKRLEKLLQQHEQKIGI